MVLGETLVRLKPCWALKEGPVAGDRVFERQGGGAEGTLGGLTTNVPVLTTATWTDILLARSINQMVTPSQWLRIVTASKQIHLHPTPPLPLSRLLAIR